MNCQPIKDIFRYHKIYCYALHTSTKKQVFEKIIFKCDTRQDLSGVRLIYNLYAGLTGTMATIRKTDKAIKQKQGNWIPFSDQGFEPGPFGNATRSQQGKLYGHNHQLLNCFNVMHKRLSNTVSTLTFSTKSFFAYNFTS